jgi:AAA domain
MPLDPQALLNRADEILDAMPEDGRCPQDRTHEAVERARAELSPEEALAAATRIVTLDEFVDVDEPGAEPLVGAPGEAVIPIAGDVMLYGDGGASKTTLGIDLGSHLAAGDDWLGIPIPKPVRVLIVEAEGPRPLFRRKLRAKRDAWQGSDLGERLHVLEEPWGAFRFPDAAEVATHVGELEIDVLIVGPLTRVGMEELGTLQQVRDFMAVVNDFRAQTGRPLTVLLIHHENKGGAVSGAWEGAGDTLLHATVHARGRTTLHFQKARWSSEWHKRTLELEWTDGEGFEAIEEEERHLEAEIARLLTERPHLTVKEIAAPKDAGGIGANDTVIKGVLETNQERFKSRTKEAAKAVGRSPTATVWEVRQDSTHLDAPSSAGGAAGEGALGASDVYDAPSADAAPLPASRAESVADAPDAATPLPALDEGAES